MKDIVREIMKLIKSGEEREMKGGDVEEKVSEEMIRMNEEEEIGGVEKIKC